MIREVTVIVCVVHFFCATQAEELNMMPNAFDDQYICCDGNMDSEMAIVLEKERNKNELFDEMWIQATNIWNTKNLNLPDAFKDEYGVAVVLYTMNEPHRIYEQLNKNVSDAGQSWNYYMEKFHFKALHFYLTRALQVLGQGCTKNFTTYRGIDQYFTVSPEIRFGRFTSSSKRKHIAERFGTKTFLTIKTCFGVDIKELSAFEEQEVLIPFAEKFRKVKEFDGNSYLVESTGQLCSYFNCAYLGGKKRTDPVCTPNNAHTRHARALQMTGAEVDACPFGTFLHSGSRESRPLLFFTGLVLILLLH